MCIVISPMKVSGISDSVANKMCLVGKQTAAMDVRIYGAHALHFKYS
jgi:hypothetical protein